MKKGDLNDLLRYAGGIDALLEMKDYTFNEGKAKGVRAIDLDNGMGLRMTVLADKCMDIPFLSYNGINIGVVGKTGIVHPSYYAESGKRGYLKTFNAGFLTTCGITNSGAASEMDGREFGMHGEISNTPAEAVNKEIVYKDDTAYLRVSGNMRETMLFEENMLLEREILLDTESNTFYINDLVTNQGFKRERLMSLYHMNIGYPFLNEGGKVYVSPRMITPHSEQSKQDLDDWNRIEAPQVGYVERTYTHTDEKAHKESFAMYVTSSGKHAIIIHYNQEQCPVLCEWKSMMAGDYALGLEPSTVGFIGVKAAEQKGLMKYAEAGESYPFNFKIELTSDPELIQTYIERSSRP